MKRVVAVLLLLLGMSAPAFASDSVHISIRVWLEINGKQIGEEQLIDVSVNYDVELFLLVSLAVAMFSLIVVGVVRTVVKLARSRGE